MRPAPSLPQPPGRPLAGVLPECVALQLAVPAGRGGGPASTAAPPLHSSCRIRAQCAGGSEAVVWRTPGAGARAGAGAGGRPAPQLH